MQAFEVAQRSWMSRELSVTRNGQDFSLLEFGVWKAAGSFSLEGKEYAVVKPGILSGALELHLDGARILETAIHGVLHPVAEWTCGEVAYGLTWALGGEATLKRADVEVGKIGRPQGWFKKLTEAEFADDVAAEVCVFALWLVAYKQNNDAAAASTAAAIH